MDNFSRVALALLRKDFPAFARRVFSTVSRHEDLSRDPYLDAMFFTATKVLNGETKRAVVNLPPRHGKTLGFVVPLVASWIANKPHAQIMVLSFRESLAEQIVDDVGRVLAASWFKAAFPRTKPRLGHKRAGDFGTTAGGRVFAHHLGRGITGEGADLIIIDDPSDISDAESPDTLGFIRNTFDNVVRNRLNHPKTGAIVIIGHRVHADDLSGHVLNEGGWTHLRLSFIAEEDEVHPTTHGTWRRSKGELLQPDSFPPSALMAIQSRANFRAVYQQAPEGEASWQLAPEDFFTFLEVPPDAGGTVLSVDTAQLPGAGHSFSVVQAWRALEGRHYLIDQLRLQVSTGELESALRRFIGRHWPSVVLIESTGFGVSLLERLQRQRKGAEVVAVSTLNRSKFERFAAVVPIVQARAVGLLQNTSWSADFIQELVEFPGSANDDQVDATSQYLAWSLDNPSVGRRPPRGLFGYATESGRKYVRQQRRFNFPLNPDGS